MKAIEPNRMMQYSVVDSDQPDVRRVMGPVLV
jgi:hypothetical protein